MLKIEQALKELYALRRELHEVGVNLDITDSEHEDMVAKLETPNDDDFEALLNANGSVCWERYHAKNGFGERGECPVSEYRVRLITCLADGYKEKAVEKQAQWKALCEGNTIPMPVKLQAMVDKAGTQARRLRDLLGDSTPPILNKKDYELLVYLTQQEGMNYLNQSELERLTKLGVVERRYYIDSFYDIPNEKGRKAMEYAKNTTRWKESI